MDDKMWTFIWLFLIPLALIPLSIPLVLEKIKPNWWYGFRTKKTLSDPKIWYPANKYSGKLMLIAGLITLIGLIVIMLFRNSLCIGTLNILGWIVAFVPITVAVILSFVYLKKL